MGNSTKNVLLLQVVAALKAISLLLVEVFCDALLLQMVAALKVNVLRM